MKTGTPTPGLQSRDVVPDKALAGHSTGPPTQPQGRVFGKSPAATAQSDSTGTDDPQERENLRQASSPTSAVES